MSEFEHQRVDVNHLSGQAAGPVALTPLVAFVPVSTEHRGDLQIDQPLQAGSGPARGLAYRLCCHPVAVRGRVRHSKSWVWFVWLRWYSNQRNGPVRPCKDWRLNRGLPGPAYPGLGSQLLHQLRGRGLFLKQVAEG